MVKLEEILEAINARKNRLLLLAEAALPASQFAAYRKLFLDELGNSGLGKDLEQVFTRCKERRG